MKIKSLKGKEKQTIFYLDLLNINFMVSTLYTSNFYTREGNLYSSKLSKNISAFCTQKKYNSLWSLYIFRFLNCKKNYASLKKIVF